MSGNGSLHDAWLVGKRVTHAKSSTVSGSDVYISEQAHHSTIFPGFLRISSGIISHPTWLKVVLGGREEIVA